jgi:hypothetical protein
MMRGTLPSMTATAELVVPRSIPITEPLTFSSPPSAYPRTNLEAMGALKAGARHAAVARGRIWQRRQYLCGGRRDAAKLTVRDNLEDSIVCVEGVLLGEMETTSW